MRSEIPPSCAVLTTACVIILVAACATGDKPAASVSVASRRDSSGITIVENTVPDGPHARQWFVDSVPRLVLGDGATTGPYEFSDVRFVLRAPSGRIVVLDGATQQIRFFDSAGKHVNTIGRQGEGPGEFANVMQIRTLGGDTLAVVDGDLRRVTIVSESGGVLATGQFTTAEMRPLLADSVVNITAPYWLRDSLVVVKGFRAAYFGPDSSTYTHEVYQMLNLASKASRVLAIHPRPIGTMVTVSDGTRRLITTVQSEYTQWGVDAGGSKVCTALPRIAQLDCTSSAGGPLRIRWVFDTIPFPAKRRAEMHDSALARLGPNARPAQRADMEMFYAKREWPPFWYPLVRFSFDSEGNVWVREHGPSSDGREVRRHRVFNAAGEHIAWANDFLATPFDMRNDEMIGVFRDADDVQRVAIYRLIKQ